MIPNLHGPHYSVRSMAPLKSIYFAYFHSTIKQGIIIWGNSSNSGKISTLQKKTVRIIVGTKPRRSCLCPLKTLQILRVPWQYTCPLMNFNVNNHKHFQTNSSVHSINTMNKHHLHRPTAKLSCFQYLSKPKPWKTNKSGAEDSEPLQCNAVTGWVVPDVPKEQCTAFPSKTMRPTHPQHHVTEGLNPQQCSCGNLKSCIKKDATALLVF
jgi:hypothetical protein